jgi:hypothetical protein
VLPGREADADIHIVLRNSTYASIPHVFMALSLIKHRELAFTFAVVELPYVMENYC